MTIRSILKTLDPVEPGIWEVSDRNGRKIKKEILRLVCAGELCVYYDEHPIDDGLKGEWHKSGDWWTGRNVDPSELGKWLFMGNWVIANKPTSVGNWPTVRGFWPINHRREFPISEKEFMETDLEYLISSFHDDDPWWVCCR